MKYLTRSVWILSVVSLLMDMASEMLYPIMPIYLQSIGFSVMLIGVLEGVAEATAGLSKGYFGKLSDDRGRRVPFVQLGYALSAISKPMMAVLVSPLWIFFARTVDRFGKGIRTGARDALLSDEATAATKGKVFGFHRSMDTCGAVLGPILALAYLQYYPEDYKTLFLLAFLPGMLSVLCSFLLKERTKTPRQQPSTKGVFSFFGYWKQSPKNYRRLVTGLLIFTVFNSSDVFLLLQVRESGASDGNIIRMYIFYNLVYALSAFPIGILADRVGLKNMFIVGLLIFAVVYLGMGVNRSVYGFYSLFFLYGIYAAATEGISKAWISNITNRQDTATAIGTFSGFQSIGAMLASSWTGFTWFYFGASTAFALTAVVALLLVLYFYKLPKS